MFEWKQKNGGTKKHRRRQQDVGMTAFDQVVNLKIKWTSVDEHVSFFDGPDLLETCTVSFMIYEWLMIREV